MWELYFGQDSDGKMGRKRKLGSIVRCFGNERTRWQGCIRGTITKCRLGWTWRKKNEGRGQKWYGTSRTNEPWYGSGIKGRDDSSNRIGMMLSNPLEMLDLDVYLQVDLNLCVYIYSCLLFIDKARAKDKTYIWVSVRWKTKNWSWGIYAPRIHWVARGTGTPKDSWIKKGEVRGHKNVTIETRMSTKADKTVKKILIMWCILLGIWHFRFYLEHPTLQVSMTHPNFFWVTISFPIEFDVWGRLCTHFEAVKVMTFASVTQHLSRLNTPTA
jgi:hypothetical protein